MRIDGAAAVVSGGARGLGAATARLLAARGARVAVFDVADGTAVAEETGGVYAACDVGDAASTKAAFAAAKAAHGPPRILVNCAGVGPMARLLRRSGPHSLDLFEAVMRVNVTGTFNCIRLAAAAMAELEPTASGDRGVVVNTASIAAFDGNLGSVAYSASKAAVAGMTLPLARDLAPYDVRVVAIAPGAFDTDMYSAIDSKAGDAMLDDVQSPKRKGRPAEFADLVGHVVENQMFNGSVVRLDAGLRIGARYG